MVRVLVVDDEAELLRLIARRLRREAVEVITAPDITSARRVLSRSRVDILCLDVDMPDGNGLDFLEEVRLTAPDLPAIVMSGNATPDRRSRAARLGVEEFLEKPFGFRKLRKLVARYGQEIKERQSESVVKTKKRWTGNE